MAMDVYIPRSLNDCRSSWPSVRASVELVGEATSVPSSARDAFYSSCAKRIAWLVPLFFSVALRIFFLCF